MEWRCVAIVGIIGAISDDRSRGQAGADIVSGAMSFCCPRSDCEADQQADRVYEGMQLGAESAAREAKSLGFNASPLRRAPAA